MNRFFHWIRRVCELLGKPPEHGRKLMEDKSWFYCYDDGLTPEDAVKEYLENNPDE